MKKNYNKHPNGLSVLDFVKGKLFEGIQSGRIPFENVEWFANLSRANHLFIKHCQRVGYPDYLLGDPVALPIKKRWKERLFEFVKEDLETNFGSRNIDPQIASISWDQFQLWRGRAVLLAPLKNLDIKWCKFNESLTSCGVGNFNDLSSLLLNETDWLVKNLPQGMLFAPSVNIRTLKWKNPSPVPYVSFNKGKVKKIGFAKNNGEKLSDSFSNVGGSLYVLLFISPTQ